MAKHTKCKIVLTGPESSGKTTMARLLAQHYETYWVPEFARYFLASLGRPYEQTDLPAIANGQVAWEAWYESMTQSLFFCDTDLTVLHVWQQFKYGKPNPQFLQKLARNPTDMYLLCKPDFPWEKDDLRENPQELNVLFDIYHHLLIGLGTPFIVLEGDIDARLTQAQAYIAQLLKNK